MMGLTGAYVLRFVLQGNGRCLVEISVAELFDSISGNIMAQEGDQLRVWEVRVRLWSFVPVRPNHA